MSKQGNRYAAEFRRQMVELVRAGCGSEELARKFEPCAPQKADPALIARFRPAMLGCFWPVFFFADHNRSWSSFVFLDTTTTALSRRGSFESTQDSN